MNSASSIKCQKQENVFFDWGEENGEGKGGKYKEKENILFGGGEE